MRTILALTVLLAGVRTDHCRDQWIEIENATRG